MINTHIENGKTLINIAELQSWDSNPRFIEAEDFTRLKKQLSELGQYKPLLITTDGVVIGGNMRFKAMSELGFQEAWVSVLDFQKVDGEDKWKAVVNGEIMERDFESPDQIMIEYAISDNDGVGHYDRQAVAEMLEPFIELIPMDQYKFDLGYGTEIHTFFDDYNKDGNDLPAESEAEKEVNDLKYLTAKFTPEQYSQIEPYLNQFKQSYNVSNNTDLFTRLLEFWSQSNISPVDTTDLPVSGTVGGEENDQTDTYESNQTDN